MVRQAHHKNDVALPLVQVIMETNEANEVQTTYTYGNDLISMNRAGVNAYYHYDGLGSVKQLTDNSGTVVANYTYDAFGNLIASAGTTENTYKFTGEQFDDSSELLYLRARYYDPSIGRFISRDPIGYRDGINVYAYVKNNSVNLTDPHGLWTLPPMPGPGPIMPPELPPCPSVDCDGPELTMCLAQIYQDILNDLPVFGGCSAACTACVGGIVPACIPCAGCAGWVLLRIAECVGTNCSFD